MKLRPSIKAEEQASSKKNKVTFLILNICLAKIRTLTEE